MKTIREWLNELPEDVRDKAIANTLEDMLNMKAKSLSSALMNAFNWGKSPEKSEFWVKIYNSL
jgi:hypothetical protein